MKNLKYTVLLLLTVFALQAQNPAPGSKSSNAIAIDNAEIHIGNGKVITYKGKPYRFTQDCEPYYGIQIFAFEITELTEKTYAEKIVSIFRLDDDSSSLLNVWVLKSLSARASELKSAILAMTATT